MLQISKLKQVNFLKYRFFLIVLISIFSLQNLSKANDITQFEPDAVIRKGNSGGPVYDSKGNIVGIAVKRFNVSRTDNYNFAIKHINKHIT